MKRRLLPWMALTMLTALTVLALRPLAQEAATASFEAASVKRNIDKPLGGFIGRQPGGRVNAVNAPLNLLLTFAYQIQGFQLVGAPSWIREERYDIVAKLAGDPPVSATPGFPDAMRLAMRTLLGDRFKLKAHRETREVDIYALVMARPGGAPGPLLKPSTVDCSDARRGPPPTQPDGAPVFCGVTGGPGIIQLGGFPLSQFASSLSGTVGRMVVDRTGLTGNWEFELRFAADPTLSGQPPGGPAPPPVDPNAPSLFTAIQEQLGLKLEATKGPVEVLVVDSIERPTPD